MPTYDYICRTCGHRFEYIQRITADALQHCPAEECIREGEEKGKGEVERVVSGGVGLVFKGEGFYLTDYVRKNGGDSAKGSSGGSGGSKSSGASDSSPKSSGGGGSAPSGSTGSSGDSKP